MTWQDTRGGAAYGPVHRVAHADDAKHRPHEATGLTRPRTGIPALLVVAGILVVLAGGGATAALVASRPGGESGPAPAATAPSADQPADPAPSVPDAPEGPAVDEVTGLPLAPADTTVAYTAVVRCVEAGAFLLSACPGGSVETLDCPDGRCRVALDLAPGFDSFRFVPGVRTYAFRAGQPALAHDSVLDPGDTCPDPVRLSGSRQPDGTYQIRYVLRLRAGELDGSCSKPSEAVYSVELRRPG